MADRTTLAIVGAGSLGAGFAALLARPGPPGPLRGAPPGPGTVAVASRGATYLGELDGRPSARAEAAAAALREAGAPTEAVTNIQTVIWSKMCNAAGLFAVTCLGRISTNRFGHYPELVRAYMGLIRETAAVAAAQGIPMGDYPRFP